MLKKTIFFFLLFLGLTTQAQEFWSGEKYDIYISLGTNIGGTSPVPVPPTVAKIAKWRAGINPAFELSTTFWHPQWVQWGLTSGLIFEFKGMQTVAEVKNFPVEVVTEGVRVQGNFWGRNQTKVRNGYIGIPLQVSYRTKGRFSFRLGAFFAYTGGRNFTGAALDGKLRKDLNSDFMFVEKENYDFSENIRAIDAGLLMSSDLYVRSGMSVKLGFSWGVLPIFKSDFAGMPYKLYNVYLNTALNYRW